MMKPSSLLLSIAACFMLFPAHTAVAGPEFEAVQVSKFSGKQVPRFESLRYSAVHGRQGPSLDHPIVWRYEREGLPVLVVRETHGWRRIRDPQGDEVWVQSRMLSATRHGLIVSDTVLRKADAPDSRPLATLKSGAVLELTGCNSVACQVKAGKLSGWVDKAQLWGTQTESAGI